MPRKSRDVDMSTQTARRRLKPRANRNPYWRALGDQRFLGYRPSRTGPGKWIARVYREGQYEEEALALADDGLMADGQSTLDYRQAIDAALAWCREAEKGPQPLPLPHYLVKDAARDYLDWYRAHRRAPEDAERRIASAILPEFGEIPVAELSTSQLRGWHQELAARPARLRPNKDGHYRTRATEGEDGNRKRRNSANRYLTTLKALLNFAVSDGKVPLSAAAAWKAVKPFRGADKPRIRHFEAGEIARLLNSCDHDFRRLVSGALLTGARYGELVSARVSDYSVRGYLEVSGKTGRRTIYLNEEGDAFFRSLVAGRPGDQPLFRRADGESWGKSHQTRRMLEAVARANIAAPNNFHILRHTYASMYLMAGGSLEGLARQLGHEDTRMTIRNYAHLAESWRSAEAKRAAPSFGVMPENVTALR